jgi:O-antigen/teichoic acid export membrane protein
MTSARGGTLVEDVSPGQGPPEDGFGLKQAGQQALIYAAGLWATRATGFLLVPLYTRRLDPSHFGIYELLSRTFDVLCLVLPAGMVMSLMRFHGLARGEERRRVASRCSPGGRRACHSRAWHWLHRSWILLFHDRAAALVLLLGMWVWFEMLFSVSCGLLRVRGQAALYTIANVVRSLLTVGLGLWLVWWRDLGLTGVMFANVIGSGLGAVAIVGYALPSASSHHSTCARSPPSGFSAGDGDPPPLRARWTATS